MIGIDSNLLVGWLIDDDSGRSPAIQHLVGMNPPIHIAHIVLAETLWVLRTRRRVRRAAVGDMLRQLLDDPDVAIERAPLVAEALTGYLQGGPGFIDHLIGTINRAAGCATTYTRDRTAARHPLFTPLP